MQRPGALKAGLAMAALLALQGCAAAAIPVIAGITVAKKQADGSNIEGSQQADASAPPREVRKAVFVGEEIPKATLAHKPVAEAVTAPAVPSPPPLVEPKPTIAAVASMPAAPVAIPMSGTSSGYLGLTSYALSRANAPKVDAVLDVIDANDPLSDPRRSLCGKLQPAVLIDLDPELQAFDPAATSPQPGLAEALTALRAAGITILWASALQVDKAEKVSAALAHAGLDPTKTDRLLLLKDPGDRKQARRVSAARNWCVIAMAGDRRGDFDEVFDYLKDPETQIPADRLFGNGWFIAPAPLP